MGSAHINVIGFTPGTDGTPTDSLTSSFAPPTASSPPTTSAIPPSPASVPNIASSPIVIGSSTFVLTTRVTAFQTTVTQPSTTFTSLVTTTFMTTVPVAISSASPTFTPIVGAQAQPVCIGHGVDASAQGLIAAIVLPSAVGLLLWLVFALIRPHFRHIYGLREWFVQPGLRPPPLRSTPWAFLFPPVPLIPSVPTDVSDAGRSPVKDAELFPADEQMSQRILWIIFLIVLALSIVGLAGALPLYMVSTPCLAHSSPRPVFHGMYSTLQDMSLLRLLYLLDEGDVTTQGLRPRAVVSGKDFKNKARIRIIILTVLAIVLGVLAPLRKILKEFKRTVAYRRRWIDVRCQRQALGWLSVRQAPGFRDWGERRLKDFILKSGLSGSLDQPKESHRRRNTEISEFPHEEHTHAEIDIQNLFTIGDTHELALLIDDRDEILENLEIAETRYISSFQLSTPEPSLADFQMSQPPPKSEKPIISRPKPLGAMRRGKRTANPAQAASSLAPTSFVAPSTYYKLRGVQGVNGGRFSGLSRRETLQESIDSRLVGSRFQEGDRESPSNARLTTTDRQGSFVGGDGFQYGPNHGADVDEHGVWEVPLENGDGNHAAGDEWIDVPRDTPVDMMSEQMSAAPGRRSFSARLRSRLTDTPSTDRRETFPRRVNPSTPSSGAPQPPPHLRVQQQQPFVRPANGINLEDLGSVYTEISEWRSKLKLINAEIMRAQEECYNEIAAGTGTKGWILVGKGLHHIPGVQIIEGRAKEDIRWDVLQHERTRLDTVVLWVIIGVAMFLLAVGAAAASGLAVAIAPDVSQYIPFLRPLADNDTLASGLAMSIAPALGATLFIAIALATIDWAVRVRGHVSVSVGQLQVYKLTFWILTIVSIVWIIAAGALIFTLQAFHAHQKESQTVAEGSIYMSAFALAIVLNIAIVFPALLLIQPIRLWYVTRSLRRCVTPRQRFRALYPRIYDPSYATGACILALIFATTFSLIFPLIGPAVVVLVFLTLVAHRFLIGYVYGRTRSQTGGLIQIWMLRRFATLLALQPILLGLILLSRRLWPEGGVSLGTGVLVITFVEIYAHRKTRLPGRGSLSAITRNSLDTFAHAARGQPQPSAGEDASVASTDARHRRRGSMASVLEMMSLTLAVMPTRLPSRGPVPLPTETLDDLIATERAARTHPDAPPHLPPLNFTDHAEEMAGILYAPELIAPPPIIWLPNDEAGVARSEAFDLQKYHGLQVTLDVRATNDDLPQRAGSFRRISTSRRNS